MTWPGTGPLPGLPANSRAPEAVLIVDETRDAKSSTDCVGAAHQYSGALGGVGLLPGRRPPHLRGPTWPRDHRPTAGSLSFMPTLMTPGSAPMVDRFRSYKALQPPSIPSMEAIFTR